MNNRQTRPLRLLSFDGGGVRGLSSLFILKEFLRRTQTSSGGDQPLPLPCECFDMICGTGTGGLIAIMLGKLRMSIDDTIDEYVKISGTISSNKKWPWKPGRSRYSARAFERALQLVIGGRARDLRWPEAATNEGLRLTTEDVGRKIMMKGNNQGHPACKVFVCALQSANAQGGSNIRTYGDDGETSGFTIWEAIRATTATPVLFKPLVFKKGQINMEYIGAEAGHNNPISDLLDEAEREFPDRTIGFILSLGTGQRNVIQLPRAGLVAKLQLLKVVNLIQEMASDCERTHQTVGNRFLSFPNTYFRFNVDQGMRGIGIEEWANQNDILAHTYAYMKRSEVGARIDSAVASFRGSSTSISMGQATGHPEGQLH
ncbi:unnamed protein product [Rhizoctonia solani]|uniref:PNPLA domain-containing protein n=1 Tax=Rhizoctonia solani TaxID=456999 RepID=A0A8H3BAL3_9AGAM|nr:unnamed protein product [Rhizoctonia solani]